MANESEGVLDVLREWRDMVCYSKGPVHPLCHGAIMNNLDRIEAAWKREREALEAHVRSLQSQLKVAYSCGEPPQGNAATMSEAMNQVLFYAQYGIQYASLNPGALKFNESEVAR